MGINDVLNSLDKTKENIEIKEEEIKEETTTFVQKVLILQEQFRSEILILINIIVLCMSNNPILWIIIMIGSVFIYTLPRIDDYIEYKKEKEMLDMVDLNMIGNTLEREDVMNKRSAYELLREYVTITFENDVLIYHNIKPGDVVNSKLEELLLKELLETIVANMSPIIRRKFELYFGNNQVDIIIGRLAFLTVSIYAANTKKDILNIKPMNT